MHDLSANCPSLFNIFWPSLKHYIQLETYVFVMNFELPMHHLSENILKKKSVYGTTNVKTMFLSFQRDFCSKNSL